MNPHVTLAIVSTLFFVMCIVTIRYWRALVQSQSDLSHCREVAKDWANNWKKERATLEGKINSRDESIQKHETRIGNLQKALDDARGSACAKCRETNAALQKELRQARVAILFARSALSAWPSAPPEETPAAAPA